MILNIHLDYFDFFNFLVFQSAAQTYEVIEEADSVRLQELLTARDPSGEVLFKVLKLHEFRVCML